MARPLNKRQRKEVHSIVNAAVSPEWKRYQGTIENKSFDETSAGAGHDLVAEIAPGTGSNDRIGRRIRVKRIEIWATCVGSPQATQCPYTSVVSCVYRVKNSTVGSAVVDTLREFFDPVAANRYVYSSAPTEASEAIRFNHHIYRMKRFRMIGAATVSGAGYNLSSAGLVNIAQSVAAYNEAQATGSGTLGTFAVTAGSLTGNSGDATAATTTHAQHLVYQQIAQPEKNVGTSLHFFKHVVKFGGRGLLVGYEDSDFEGSYKQNHLVWNYASSLAEGVQTSNPLYCPGMSAVFRVWFTDD